MADEIKPKQLEWDATNSRANETEKNRKRPKYSAKAFIVWAQKKVGPLTGKPYASCTVLCKVALGLHSTVRSFIARKFAGTEEEAKCAEKCFTRGALGTGTFWNLGTVTPELQLYWVRSLYNVQKNKDTRYDSKVKFKGTHVKKFEKLCRWNVQQLSRLSHRLDLLTQKYEPEVSQKVFAVGKFPELKKAKENMLNHKYHDQVFRNGERKLLIPAMQGVLKSAETKLDAQAKKLKDARDAQVRVEALIKKKSEMEAAKVAEEKLEKAREELQYMVKACQRLQEMVDEGKDSDVDTLPAECLTFEEKAQVLDTLRAECLTFEEKAQVLIDSKIFEQEDSADLLVLKNMLESVLGASNSKFVDNTPVDISYVI